MHAPLPAAPGRPAARTLLVALVGLLAAIALATPAIGATFKFSDADAEAIIGEVQKPDVTVVISRENLNKAYDLQLEESFLNRIIDAVERAPF